MAIKLNNKELSSAIENMLQGLVYWMGYKTSMNDADLLELDFVHKARQILRVHLNKNKYAIYYEYPYDKLCKGVKGKRADIVITSKVSSGTGGVKEDPICVMEFKMSTNTNGGVESDVERLSKIAANPNLDRLVILLFLEKNQKLQKQYTKDSGTNIVAHKNPIMLKKNKYLSNVSAVNVRRVTKAMSTSDGRRIPYMGICISV